MGTESCQSLNNQALYSVISPSSTTIEGLEPNVALSEPSDTAVWAFWHARDGRELLFSLSFFILCSLSCAVLNSTRQRPIPFQLLSTGEIVRNLSNDEVFDGDTVSDTWLIVISMIFPVLAQYSLSSIFHGQSAVTEGTTPHATLCMYLVAFGINVVCTDRIKAYCGCLRPSFYDLCQVVVSGDGSSSSYETCSSKNASTARRSFPSGHASVSFCGLTLLSLFFHHTFGVPRLRLERQKFKFQKQNTLHESINNETGLPDTRHPGSRHGGSCAQDLHHPLRYRCMSILSLTPMGLALFISASRVVDNRHFPVDVVGGSVLGTAVAIFVHSLWQ